jgi:hypothetical protein
MRTWDVTDQPWDVVGEDPGWDVIGVQIWVRGEEVGKGVLIFGGSAARFQKSTSSTCRFGKCEDARTCNLLLTGAES